MPSLRRASRHAVVPCLAVAALASLASVASRAGAQPLPGSQPTDAPGSFTRLVRAGVDSTLAHWSAAAAARDTGTLARLYATTGAIYPTYGNPIHGRRAIGDALAQALPRVTRARFSIERLDASGDLAPRIAWAAAPRATLARGQTDTVTVRVTDALGGGIRDVLVSFATDRDAATIVPSAVRTDARDGGGGAGGRAGGGVHDGAVTSLLARCRRRFGRTGIVLLMPRRRAPHDESGGRGHSRTMRVLP